MIESETKQYIQFPGTPGDPLNPWKPSQSLEIMRQHCTPEQNQNADSALKLLDQKNPTPFDDSLSAFADLIPKVGLKTATQEELDEAAAVLRDLFGPRAHSVSCSWRDAHRKND